LAIRAHLGPETLRFGRVDPRSEERRALFLEASGALPGGLEANVIIHNISAAGLLLETEIELAAGERMTLDLPQAGAVDAVIVWQSRNLFGCAFETALSEAALAAVQLQGNGSAPPNDLVPEHQGEPLGVRINRLRREKGLTLAQVAGALDVSKPTVWAWEKGKARPLPDRLAPLAQVLGADPHELEQRAHAPQHTQLVQDCRLRIATAYGTEPSKVRIMIEI
jgi:transcriptional regulator with XRE-family HTH domain